MLCYYYSTSLQGHRYMYINALSLQKPREVVIAPANFESIVLLSLKPEPVIFITVDDSLPHYMLCSFVRMLLGRKTIGIFLQPLGVVKKHIAKELIKGILLSLFVKLKIILILSIYPRRFSLGFFKYYSDWIYDPAFWDLAERESLPYRATDQTNYPYEFEPVRLYVLFLGTISNRKRFDLFVECCEASHNFPDLRFLAVGERYTSDKDDCDVVSGEVLKRFSDCGGVLLEKYLTEEEVIYFQENAHIHWAFYAENFDQSSGIAGRAYQLDKLVIVRKYSLINEMLDDLGCSKVALTEAEVLDFFKSKENFDHMSTRTFSTTMPIQLRDRSLRVLHSACGIL